MANMTLAEFFDGLADAIRTASVDRELTNDEIHSLQDAANEFETTPTARQLLGSLGLAMDGWTTSIGACIAAMWNWITSW
jgi:hypothetical protein